jgi:hypothetical protein
MKEQDIPTAALLIILPLALIAILATFGFHP